jgi:Spy/CpxP family protein refolding chaperone
MTLKPGHQILLALTLVMVVFIAAPAAAGTTNPWDSDQQDGMCQDLTGNWVTCSSTGGGSGGGGTAPVMETCTSGFGCQKCFLSTNG